MRSYIEIFPSLSVCVIGDVMLDVFTYGRVDRVSPEAPVPVVSVERDVYIPGGAANVAMNIRALGGKVSLFGRRGADAAGMHLSALLAADGISPESLLVSDTYPTIEKHRYIAGGTHVVRVDREVLRPCEPEEEETEIERICAALDNAHALVFADYGKGYVSASLAARVLEAAHARALPVIVDTKPENISFFSGVSIITPNKKEALEMTAMETIEGAGARLREMVGGPVLITCGAEGMALFAEDDIHRVEAHSLNPLDVSGAGDTVVSTLALMLGAGASLIDAMHMANRAAAVAVEKPGTATVTYEECLACL